MAQGEEAERRFREEHVGRGTTGMGRSGTPAMAESYRLDPADQGPNADVRSVSDNRQLDPSSWLSAAMTFTPVRNRSLQFIMIQRRRSSCITHQLSRSPLKAHKAPLARIPKIRAHVEPRTSMPADRVFDVSEFGSIPGGPSPLYYRIVSRMKEQIARRKPVPGTKLPTEDQLAKHFGVSIITIRAALKELADLGMIERQQGRGTFIRQADAAQSEWALGSIEDLVATSRSSAGLRPKSPG
jgi:DNA-binding transcriptional regulator YhcF (GntR family)